MPNLNNISSFFLFIVAVIIISSSSNSINVVDNPIRLVSPSDNALPSAFSPNFGFSIDNIYQFGDSISDAGNYILEHPNFPIAKPPYGMTYFHKPTGRASDGRLMIDYIAQHFGLPFIEPYLNKSGNFKHGVNFAVAGATALNVSTLLAKNIVPEITNHSLSVQVNWFKSHLASICLQPTACRIKISRAVFIVGEIGSNDYYLAITAGKSLNILYQMVLEVVEAISTSLEELISIGAGLILIPGNILSGCMPLYLAGSNPNDSSLYDELKCMKYVNDLAKVHNHQLRIAIRKFRLKHPHTIILYMDLEEASRKIIQNPTTHGFDKDVVFKTCCGKGNDDYNFNSNTVCGTQGVEACQHPETRVNWDGYHFTSRVYEIIVKQQFTQIGGNFNNFAQTFSST